MNELIQAPPKKSLKTHIKETLETFVIAFFLAVIIKTFLFQIFYIPSGSMIPTLMIKDRLVVIKPFYGIQNPIYNAKHKKTFLYVVPNPLYKVDVPLSSNKYVWEFKSSPKRFDVVVFYPPEEPMDGAIHFYTDNTFRKVTYFRPPQKPGSDYIKRLIGLPGEVIEVKDGYIYADNIKIDESKHLLIRDEDNFGPVKVPHDAYFAMGDNRPRSSDSRVWGFLPAENIVGKAVFKIWPLTRAGAIK